MSGGVERDFYNKDVKVVEQLFKSGKIYFLLATTAVGVGVNLAVRNIYVPSIMMYSQGGYGKMDTSTLVQLINRAGRGASNITVANIFCHPDDVVWITTLINSGDPSQHVNAIPFKDKKDPDSLINIFKRGKGTAIQKQIAAEFIQRGTINKSSKTEPRTRIVY
jgi:superfamily II DNA helicase RecQ